MSTPHQDDIDYLARRFHEHDRACAQSSQSISLADQLLGRCPKCGALMLAGSIRPERAREMLAELQERWRMLGLP